VLVCGSVGFLKIKVFLCCLRFARGIVFLADRMRFGRCSFLVFAAQFLARSVASLREDRLRSRPFALAGFGSCLSS
jgi:hypothetical protein